jgi:TM2 domain-containing membrane protein YozV
MKKTWVAYLLWFFLGLLGVHRFYLGHIGVGIAQLLTVGGGGLWWIIDAFLIPSRVEQVNLKKRTERLERSVTAKEKS